VTDAFHSYVRCPSLPTKTSIPVCTVDDVFNRRFNDGQPVSGLLGITVIGAVLTARQLALLTAPATPRWTPSWVGTGLARCWPPGWWLWAG
jgi:hypothetical protein